MKPAHTRTVTNDKIAKAVREGVAHQGYDIIHMLASPECPQYTYTVGLVKKWHHPELLISALESQSACNILRIAVWEIMGGRTFSQGMSTEDLINYPIAVIEIPQDWISTHMPGADSVNPVPFRAFQMVLSDETGKFPWEKGAQRPFHGQQIVGAAPRLGCARLPHGKA